MRVGMILILASGLFAAVTAHAQDDAVKAELKKIQGNWIRIYEESNGKKREDGKKKPATPVTMLINDKYLDNAFKLDPTKNPKHIDLSLTDEKGNPVTMKGIYEVKGDILKVSFPIPIDMKTDNFGNRPTQFTTKPGDKHGVEVFKRDKK